MSRRSLLGVLAIVMAMTLVFTWPQGAHLASQVAAHNDPHFSMWRLEWIAHALRTDPAHLFDTNIFYPEPRTLAYSDATLLEGVVAAPFPWAGAPRVLVYNLLLLGGIAASGMAMFLLARRLTGSAGAALVSAAVFTMAPYRIEHIMHLELQWTMWMPLAFLAVHRAFEERPLRWGAMAGLFIGLQVLSCVYYGIFLAMLVAVLVVLLAASDARRARAALPGLALGAVVAAALILPYAWPYLQTARALGPRDITEITQYSAKPINYLASPPQNWLWGWTADRFGSNEARVFPGLGAVLLAVVGLLRRPTRLAWVYAALAALAVELSFGLNGRPYTWLYETSSALHGLRAPARFAILASCALAVVAGFGFQALGDRLRTARVRRGALVAVLVLLTAEVAPSKMFLVRVEDGPPDVYKMIRAMGSGVVAELPMPRADALPGWDVIYEFWSVNHWHQMLNGYSGYYPPSYMNTLEIMRGFPDDKSIAHLRALNVRFLVVHRSLYPEGGFAAALERMMNRRELRSVGAYRDPVGDAQIFELRR